MKVKITESYYDEGYGYNIIGESIEVLELEKPIEYNVYEGESEDMIFGRNLESVGTIQQMIKLAHEAGKNGEELTFETVEEKDN